MPKLLVRHDVIAIVAAHGEASETPALLFVFQPVAVIEASPSRRKSLSLDLVAGLNIGHDKRTPQIFRQRISPCPQLSPFQGWRNP
ncbi:MAG: hypothetical protein ROZ09_05485 [Thiobacillus sp.]|nr:hypothetical protein [Thiobacillus sp.]MDT3706258.1 hypothetical protein [Thiobacillus sp.]